MAKQDPVLSPESSVFVAGHRGMVGSAIVRRLKGAGYANIVKRTRDELDLTDQGGVRSFFRKEKIDWVVLAAARVGGIHANNAYPAEFIRNNLMIEANVIHEAWAAGVTRFLFLGSSCIYPRNAPQPMKEEYLLTGLLEPTNEPYAVAKIAGIKLCEAYNRQYGTKYRSVMPTNLFGPGDNYDLENSHVVPALIRKFHLAKMALQGNWKKIENDEACYGKIPDDIHEDLNRLSAGSSSAEGSRAPVIRLWGTGRPRREIMHVDDMAAACVFLMGLPDAAFDSALIGKSKKQVPLDGAVDVKPGTDRHNQPTVSHINIGTGKDNTIKELAEMIRTVVDADVEIKWDPGRPDGSPRKFLDATRLNRMGWNAGISVLEGLKRTYQDYLAHARINEIKP